MADDKGWLGVAAGGLPPGAYLEALNQIVLQLGAQVQATTYNPVASYLFAGLPAAPGVGTLAVVTNSNTAVWGAAIAGGGANVVLAFWNGGAWTVAAK